MRRQRCWIGTFLRAFLPRRALEDNGPDAMCASMDEPRRCIDCRGLTDSAQGIIWPIGFTMLKRGPPGTELPFSVRRERDGRFVAVSGDAGTESLVVTAPTLKDLHISLANRVTVEY